MIPGQSSFRRRFSQPKNNFTTPASNSLTSSTNRQLPTPTATLNTGPSLSVVDKSLGVPPSTSVPPVNTSVNSGGVNSSGVNTGPSSIPSSILNIPINSGQLSQPVMGPNVAPTNTDFMNKMADMNERPGYGYEPGSGGREGFLARGGTPLLGTGTNQPIGMTGGSQLPQGGVNTGPSTNLTIPVQPPNEMSGPSRISSGPNEISPNGPIPISQGGSVNVGPSNQPQFITRGDPLAPNVGPSNVRPFMGSVGGSDYTDAAQYSKALETFAKGYANPGVNWKGYYNNSDSTSDPKEWAKKMSEQFIIDRDNYNKIHGIV